MGLEEIHLYKCISKSGFCCCFVVKYEIVLKLKVMLKVTFSSLCLMHSCDGGCKKLLVCHGSNGTPAIFCNDNHCDEKIHTSISYTRTQTHAHTHIYSTEIMPNIMTSKSK